MQNAERLEEGSCVLRHLFNQSWNITVRAGDPGVVEQDHFAVPGKPSVNAGSQRSMVAVKCRKKSSGMSMVMPKRRLAKRRYGLADDPFQGCDTRSCR
ncbi:MAG: hypothetical protein AUF67_14715 [Acidobacteria bacterium 13_1_20CM_58_21]|nr:MAG: hypothetical protein AUF67_14715 [Acidobacteria bacterium 13_1_20CM_58_21]